MLNKKKGFTLAELLIVIAIIGVLVGIAIPVLNSQLEKSEKLRTYILLDLLNQYWQLLLMMELSN